MVLNLPMISDEASRLVSTPDSDRHTDRSPLYRYLASLPAGIRHLHQLPHLGGLGHANILGHNEIAHHFLAVYLQLPESRQRRPVCPRRACHEYTHAGRDSNKPGCLIHQPLLRRQPARRYLLLRRCPISLTALRAFIRPQNTNVRIGPGNIYTVTGTIEANTEVNLLGTQPYR